MVDDNLKVILKKLNNIEVEIKEIKAGLSAVENKVNDFENSLKGLKKDQAGFNEQIIERVSDIEDNVLNIVIMASKHDREILRLMNRKDLVQVNT